MLSKEELDRRIATIRSEYTADPSNLDELILSMEELSTTPNASFTFVQKNADHMFDCKEGERKAITSLIALLYEKEKLLRVDIENGLSDTIEFIDSMTCDAPNAYEYMGEMLSTLLHIGAVHVAWWVDQMEKTKELSPNSPTYVCERMVKETMVAFAKLFGKDGAIAFFNECSGKMIALLGDDSWNSISTSILG